MVVNVTVWMKSLAIKQMVYAIAKNVNQDGGETHVTKVCIYDLIFCFVRSKSAF